MAAGSDEVEIEPVDAEAAVGEAGVTAVEGDEVTDAPVVVCQELVDAFERRLFFDGEEINARVHAVLEHPFKRVADGLGSAKQWCEVLVLPFNVQKCESEGGKVKLLAVMAPKRSSLVPDVPTFEEAGLGTYKAVYPLAEDPRKVTATFVNHAHNDVLELILELSDERLIHQGRSHRYPQTQREEDRCQGHKVVAEVDQVTDPNTERQRSRTISQRLCRTTSGKCAKACRAAGGPPRGPGRWRAAGGG